jgi:hypothetical protein
MMNATTEATKLNFMTDQGSMRDSVSMAWRLFERRTLTLGADFSRGADFSLGPDPLRNAEVTEFASPAAAPPIPAAAPAAPEVNPDAPEVNPPPLDDALWVPLVPAGALNPAESAVVAGPVASGVLDQDDRE